MGLAFKAAGNIFFLIAEQETAGKNAAFHARITRSVLDQTAMSIFFVRATPATVSHDASAPVQFITMFAKSLPDLRKIHCPAGKL